MSKPLSSRLANIEPEQSAVAFFGGVQKDGTHRAYVTQEFHDAWMDEMKLRWERDKAFARRTAHDHGYDIDELAAGAPEYARD